MKKNQIPLTNVIVCATDAALSMIGHYHVFIALLKAANSHMLTIHCVIHWQHLVTKNMSDCFNLSLNTTIKAVNKIKAR